MTTSAVSDEERRTAGHLQALSDTIANDAPRSSLFGRRTVRRGKGENRHRKVRRKTIIIKDVGRRELLQRDFLYISPLSRDVTKTSSAM